MEKITELTVREINMIDHGINMVAGLTFPFKVKYKMGKIQNQLSRFTRAFDEAKKDVNTQAVTKFKLKIDEKSHKPIFTMEANLWIDKQLKDELDKKETIDNGLFPFTVKEMEEAEAFIREWNDEVKAKDQPSITVPNAFYSLMYPIIVYEDEKKKTKKPVV